MTGTAHSGSRSKLPFLVRVMRRVSARSLPAPMCSVAVETGIDVPARDGVMLRTDHYIPLAGGPRPTLLVRSPYGRGFPWDYLYGAQFAGQGFHVVIQSCRGTGGSGGAFEPCRHERDDGQAAVAWLRAQEWFRGALGTIGPSYLGYVQWALAADPPPELRALVVQNGFYDLHSFLYRGGALDLEDALTGSAAALSFERGVVGLVKAMIRLQRRHGQVERTLPLIDAYPAAFGGRVAFFEQWLTNPDRSDPYWSGLDAGTGAENLAVPTSLVSGWYDVFLDQTLEQYERLRGGGREVRLVVGPWTHTSAFDKGWPVVFADAIGWLRKQLCDQRSGQLEQPVRVHVGGCDEWRDLPDWPPQALIQPWYLDGDGTLGAEPPAQASLSSVRYDPALPTPSVGGPVLNSRASGARRNNALEARADVLVFTSPPLTEALEVLGPVSARLQVRASSPHFDVFARLCDVDPQGHSRNICDGLVRQGPASASGTAGSGSTITVPMSSTAYRFAAGHRLRLQISGGAHPRFARNTGTGEPPATATRLVPVDIQIIHAADRPCALSLPVAAGARPPLLSTAGGETVPGETVRRDGEVTHSA